MNHESNHLNIDMAHQEQFVILAHTAEPIRSSIALYLVKGNARNE